MKVFSNFQQKNGGDPTAEWLSARIGKPTASQFKQFVTLDGKLRKGEMPETYLDEKLFERWTCREVPKKKEFFDMAMNNGVILEEKAALWFEMKFGLDIQHVGFVSNDDETVGASPDGLIDFGKLRNDVASDMPVPPDGASGIEIKTRGFHKHIGMIRRGVLPDDYFCQIQGCMFLTGCQTWHFVGYSMPCYLDGFPPLHLVIERDEKWQANFAEAIEEFMAKFDAEFKKLCDLNGGPPIRFNKPEPQPSPTDEKFDIH